MPEEQNHAIALHRAGHLDEAAAIYRRILEAEPDNAEALHLLGVVAGPRRDQDQCVRLIERAISHVSDVAKYHANLGAALMELRRFDEAAQAFERAVALDPDYSEAHYKLGLALESRGRPDEAVTSYRRVLEIDPAHADACNNLGVALQLDGRTGEAREYFRRAVAIAADHAPALSNLGRSVLDDGLADEALVHLRRALEIEPNDPDVLVNFGMALEERRDFEASEAQFRRAISIDPDHAAAYGHLGALFQHQGKNEDAIAAYRRAIEINPGWELPAHFLAALTGETTQSAPAGYVQGLFDNHARGYENHMVEDLQYRVPTFLRSLVGRLMEPGRRFDKVIDLGCGTGLSGVQFRDAARCLHGVDLSPRMIEESEKKNVYDRLEVANVRDFLSAPGTRYDLFIATDVFNYLGTLDDIFAAVRKRAERNAFFAFSTETCEGDHYVLATTGRYTHSMPYVEGLARANGFRVGAQEHVQLRLQSGQPVMGDIYVLLCSSV